MTTTTEYTLPIRGMTGASCAAHIKKSLGQVPGVGEVSVNLAAERARVSVLDPDVDTFDLVNAVRDAGYDVATESMILPIDGMTCASCAAHVEGALTDVPGVLQASVNLATERATVAYIPELVGLDDFRQAVGATGYRMLDHEDENSKRR
jgi:Cu+-exporting ATPase